MNPTLRTLRKRQDRANWVVGGMIYEAEHEEMHGKLASCLWKDNMVSVLAREALAFQKMLASRSRKG